MVFTEEELTNVHFATEKAQPIGLNCRGRREPPLGISRDYFIYSPLHFSIGKQAFSIYSNCRKLEATTIGLAALK